MWQSLKSYENAKAKYLMYASKQGFSVWKRTTKVVDGKMIHILLTQPLIFSPSLFSLPCERRIEDFEENPKFSCQSLFNRSRWVDWPQTKVKDYFARATGVVTLGMLDLERHLLPQVPTSMTTMSEELKSCEYSEIFLPPSTSPQ